MKNRLIFTTLVGLFLLNIHCKNSNDITSEKLWTEGDRKFIVAELNRTTNELMAEIDSLSNAQWNFRENPERWSINEIVEHLEVQNELHFREIIAISKTPQLLQYLPVVKGLDDKFSAYATDTLKRNAKWFLEPIGRFCSKEESILAFQRARNHLSEFVKETQVDLRKHFTFGKYIEGKKLNEINAGEVLDLHQLLLIGIAHTDRHLKQIKTIKEHLNYKELL